VGSNVDSLPKQGLRPGCPDVALYCQPLHHSAQHQHDWLGCRGKEERQGSTATGGRGKAGGAPLRERAARPEG
jgi:hypothetical protein